jgi:hypothetical protein
MRLLAAIAVALAADANGLALMFSVSMLCACLVGPLSRRAPELWDRVVIRLRAAELNCDKASILDLNPPPGEYWQFFPIGRNVLPDVAQSWEDMMKGKDFRGTYEDFGLSQTEVASMCDLTTRQVRRICSGEAPVPWLVQLIFELMEEGRITAEEIQRRRKRFGKGRLHAVRV